MVERSTGKGRKKSKNARVSLPRGLKQVNLNAAGIDIGSRSHYVSVPQDCTEQAVQVFGCFTNELHDMARWLLECGIETVAMESTGVYWIPVVDVLETYGFEVLLVDAFYVKQIPGRKTDVQDCQWIQELHTFGLLKGAFRPTSEVRVLRGYWRHRAGLVELCAQQIHLMHKALDQMNLHLHKVLSDVTGVSGLTIIRAIASGMTKPTELAKLAKTRISANQETLVKALTGHYREEHLFALKQSVELYDVVQQKIADCDSEIEAFIKRLIPEGEPSPQLKSSSYRRKNQPYFNLRSHIYQMVGVDLTKVPGLEVNTAFTVLTEVGIDMSKFPSEKNFASYLRLAPRNQKTGGRIIRRSTGKTNNRATTALRVAAQSLARSNTALGAFYRRIRARHGPAVAITATARKIAIIYYRLLKHGKEYVDLGQDYYDERYRNRQVTALKKRAIKLGFELVLRETEVGVS